jgi:hypothetical protein
VYGGRRRAATKSRYVANFLARSGVAVTAGRPPDSLLARNCSASTKSAAPSARERERVLVRAMSVRTADADHAVSCEQTYEQRTKDRQPTWLYS